MMNLKKLKTILGVILGIVASTTLFSQDTKATLNLSTTPDHAQVWMDGVYMGRSPVIIKEIDEGPHRITAKFYADGRAFVGDIELPFFSGQDKDFCLTLRPLLDESAIEAALSFGGSFVRLRSDLDPTRRLHKKSSNVNIALIMHPPTNNLWSKWSITVSYEHRDPSITTDGEAFAAIFGYDFNELDETLSIFPQIGVSQFNFRKSGPGFPNGLIIGMRCRIKLIGRYSIHTYLNHEAYPDLPVKYDSRKIKASGSYFGLGLSYR